MLRDWMGTRVRDATPLMVRRGVMIDLAWSLWKICSEHVNK